MIKIPKEVVVVMVAKEVARLLKGKEVELVMVAEEVTSLLKGSGIVEGSRGNGTLSVVNGEGGGERGEKEFSSERLVKRAR